MRAGKLERTERRRRKRERYLGFGHTVLSLCVVYDSDPAELVEHGARVDVRKENEPLLQLFSNPVVIS